MRKSLLFTVCCLMMALGVSAQIPSLERVEPMFWWVGMHNPDLQLIVHGDHIERFAEQALFHEGPEHEPADAAETVDANFESHWSGLGNENSVSRPVCLRRCYLSPLARALPNVT